MSDTPRTDAVCNTPLMGTTVTEHKWEKLQELARQLERENNAMRMDIEENDAVIDDLRDKLKEAAIDAAMKEKP